ncbi:hypothetical protein Vadar_022388 [Vaccinium darrowii]|uniref:Uncharacterized protein n=1 Tax=Vaccinium darrowii TaxID=229202 RepID=A0ACB7Y1T4_9ERIC|nr:hypothetical protein Vadar_022388 [Vaccinium darrowii]
MLSCWNSNGLISGPYFAFQPVNLNFGFDRKPDLVLGPCDGLFCLYWRPTKFYPRHRVGHLVKQVPTIALWNPATRAFSILPLSKLALPPYKAVYSYHVGFGFDLKTKSIKVVKVANLSGDEATDHEYINRAEVYDLVFGSWRVLDVDDTLQQVFVLDEPTHDVYNNNDGVFHWHSYGKSCGDIRHHSLVLSFDMSRELFHVTRMPEKYSEFDTFFHFSLLRDSLAVNFSFVKDGHQTIAIWVMKKDFYREVEAGESLSSYGWSHELTVDLTYRHLCLSTGFWNINELLLWNIDDELTLRTPVLYDIVTKQIRSLGGLNILISFDTDDSLTEFMQDNNQLLPQWFSSIERWHNQRIKPSKSTWISCYGVPLIAWNSETFMSIGKLWGESLKTQWLKRRGKIGFFTSIKLRNEKKRKKLVTVLEVVSDDESLDNEEANVKEDGVDISQTSVDPNWTTSLHEAAGTAYATPSDGDILTDMSIIEESNSLVGNSLLKVSKDDHLESLGLGSKNTPHHDLVAGIGLDSDRKNSVGIDEDFAPNSFSVR